MQINSFNNKISAEIRKKQYKKSATNQINSNNPNFGKNLVTSLPTSLPEIYPVNSKHFLSLLVPLSKIQKKTVNTESSNVSDKNGQMSEEEWNNTLNITKTLFNEVYPDIYPLLEKREEFNIEQNDIAGLQMLQKEVWNLGRLKQDELDFVKKVLYIEKRGDKQLPISDIINIISNKLEKATPDVKNKIAEILLNPDTQIDKDNSTIFDLEGNKCIFRSPLIEIKSDSKRQLIDKTTGDIIIIHGKMEDIGIAEFSTSKSKNTIEENSDGSAVSKLEIKSENATKFNKDEFDKFYKKICSEISKLKFKVSHANKYLKECISVNGYIPDIYITSILDLEPDNLDVIRIRSKIEEYEKTSSDYILERTTTQDKEGKISIFDDKLSNLNLVIEPNKSKNGMHIQKSICLDNGQIKEIDLTSEIKDKTVTITDNKTKHKKSFSLQNIIESKDISEKGIELIPDKERENAIIELFKKLSPTTILDIFELKNTYPDLRFPFIKEQMKSYCKHSDLWGNSVTEITLSLSPEIVSHEIQHGITFKYNLTEEPTIKNCHEIERKIDTGFLGNEKNILLDDLSKYARNGNGISNQRGENEAISILQTLNTYGKELQARSAATRVQYPETAKNLELYMMKHYEEIIKTFSE